MLPFLGDNSPVLPVVQYLKTVVSYILFNILIIYIRSVGLELVSLSWLEVEIPHYYFYFLFKYFLLFIYERKHEGQHK